MKLVHHEALKLKISLSLNFNESYNTIQYVRLKIYIPISRIHTTVINMKACVKSWKNTSGVLCFGKYISVTHPGAVSLKALGVMDFHS